MYECTLWSSDCGVVLVSFQVKLNFLGATERIYLSRSPRILLACPC